MFEAIFGKLYESIVLSGNLLRETGLLTLKLIFGTVRTPHWLFALNHRESIMLYF